MDLEAPNIGEHTTFGDPPKTERQLQKQTQQRLSRTTQISQRRVLMNESHQGSTHDPMRKEEPAKVQVYKRAFLLGTLATTVLSLLLLFQLSPSDTTNEQHTSTPERNLFIRFSKVYDRHPQDAFTRHVACIDITLPDCNPSNKLEFVGPSVVDPQPNQFRYHNTGPTSMQGAFWFKDQQPGNTALVSFARTRQAPGGIATGDLNDEGDYAAVMRPRGDHNWAFAGENVGVVGSSLLNELVDVTYEFELSEGASSLPLCTWHLSHSHTHLGLEKTQQAQ